MSVTIKSIRENFLVSSSSFSVNNARKTKKQKVTIPKIPGAGRYVKWNPGLTYVCVKTGTITFGLTSEIDLIFKNQQITDEMFFVFKNTDPNLERNQTIPVYEAVYKTTSGLFYKTQKSHLKQGYANSKRLDNNLAWTFVETNVPYWVDRHIFSKKIKQYGGVRE